MLFQLSLISLCLMIKVLLKKAARVKTQQTIHNHTSPHWTNSMSPAVQRKITWMTNSWNLGLLIMHPNIRIVSWFSVDFCPLFYLSPEAFGQPQVIHGSTIPLFMRIE